MKTLTALFRTVVLVFFGTLALTPVFGGSVSSTVDGGGQRVASANYIMDGSVGGIGGTPMGGEVSLKPGYVGQLTDVTNVAITAAPSTIDEGDNVQLAGTAAMDDGSVTPLMGSEIAWPGPAYPVLTISPAGLAETMPVYAGVNASVTGLYLGVTGSGAFLVRDANPDNFGIYAADSVPDWWQVQRFGIHNFDGLAHANPDQDMESNLDEFIADTNPNDSNSYFHVAAVSNSATEYAVKFWSSTNRKYSLSYNSSLLSPDWAPVSGQTNVWGNGAMKSLSNANSSLTRVYRVSVQIP